MSKEISYHENIRKSMLSGIDQLATAVKATLGPLGRNAVIQRTSALPLITNDGATIAKEIELTDPFENMGAKIIRDVTLKTNDLAGDGTTTATVLAHRLIREGFRNIAAGASPVELKKGIQGAAQLSVAALKRIARPVETKSAIAQVAASSAEDPVIGGIIADAMELVGPEGVITIEESHGTETTLSVTKGMQYEKGFLNAHMISNKDTMTEELNDPYILITDREIMNFQELLPIFEQIAEKGAPLLIIAEKLEGDALTTLILNKMQGRVNVVAVHPPAYGNGRRERMEDIAIYTGGTFITEQNGFSLREASIDMLGRASSVKVDAHSTTIIGGAGDDAAVQLRASSIRALIEATDYEFDKKRLQERLAKFVSGTAVISIGAATEVEIKEKKLRAEDALHAAKSAAAEGILPGGGTAYMNIRPAVQNYVDSLSGDRKTGATLILRALEEPLRQISENAGYEGSTVAIKVAQSPRGIGFDAMRGEYVDMLEAGIVDSLRVARTALLCAASVSATLLTTEAGVTDLEPDDIQSAAGG